jgi:TonB family protein
LPAAAIICGVMRWNSRKTIIALLPLLAVFLAPLAARAQEPSQPPLQPQPPRYLLGGVEPLLNDQMKVVDLLLAKKWREARSLAHQQFLVLAGYGDKYPASAATGLLLEALADAGLGSESEALCRWQAARSLDPNLGKADLSQFGAAGALLDSHAVKASTKDPDPLKLSGEVEKPQLLSHSSPQYPPAARKAKVEGKVVVEAIIDKDGGINNARVLQDQPLGLGLSAVEAVCGWRFKPATLQGQPVKVYYVLTVNFTVEKGPPPAISNP